MGLIDTIETALYKDLTENFAEFLSDEYGLDVDDIRNSINKYLGCKTLKYKPKIIEVKTIETTPIKSINSGAKLCPFLISRGKKENTICNTLVRVSGEEYCSKHKHRKSIKKIDM
jgi:hypothetical protein